MLTIRRYLIVVFMIAMALGAVARDPQRGYRGFVDANTDLTFQQAWYGDPSVIAYYSLSTSHGFQINPHYFLGAGLGFERVSGYWNSECVWIVAENPIFLHARTDWTVKGIPLYGDVRVGGVLFGEYRFYLSPTVGYRLNWGRKANLNFGLGMTFRGAGWSDTKTLHPQLAIRIGVDF